MTQTQPQQQPQLQLQLRPQLQAQLQAPPRTCRLRPAHAGDVEALQRFVGRLSLASRVQRFFVPLRELPAEQVRALRQADPAQRFVIAEADAEPIALGQLAVQGEQGEIALVVADAWQGGGVGSRLLGRLLDEASRGGLREVVMHLLAGNRGMRALARRSGFDLQRDPGDADLMIGRRRLAA